MENQNFNSDLKKISIAGSKLISIYYWIVSLVIITIFNFFQVKYNVLPSLINTILPIFELIIYIFILRNLLSAGRNLEYAFTIPNKNLEIPLSSSEYYQELSENFNNDSSIIEIRNSCPGCNKDINETDQECPTCGLSLNN